MNIIYSKTKQFKAIEVDESITGSQGIFHLYNTKTHLNIGKLYGEEGKWEPAYTGCSLTGEELKQIIELIYKIERSFHP